MLTMFALTHANLHVCRQVYTKSLICAVVVVTMATRNSEVVHLESSIALLITSLGNRLMLCVCVCVYVCVCVCARHVEPLNKRLVL